MYGDQYDQGQKLYFSLEIYNFKSFICSYNIFCISINPDYNVDIIILPYFNVRLKRKMVMDFASHAWKYSTYLNNLKNNSAIPIETEWFG